METRYYFNLRNQIQSDLDPCFYIETCFWEWNRAEETGEPSHMVAFLA